MPIIVLKETRKEKKPTKANHLKGWDAKSPAYGFAAKVAGPSKLTDYSQNN
jgi:hypothetical protein